MKATPLIVDLDGTLIHTDMLHESALQAVGNNPLIACMFPIWLSHGKAFLKKRLADKTSIIPESLPYNTVFLDWLRKERESGRVLVLCTASDHAIASAISEHLGIFDDVIASDGSLNLAGENKAKALEERYGKGGFDYAGNGVADLAVWRLTRKAIVVNASQRLQKAVGGCCEVERVFPPSVREFSSVWRHVFRIQQWLKNLLIFIPLFASHQLMHFTYWQSLSLAFIAFCLCASAVYIANDLLDLQSDRLHPRKRNRPFASGAVPLWLGVILSPLLLLASLLLAEWVGGTFLPWLASYFILTCLYSWRIKRVVLVDCIVLAMLYTLRLVAGAAATNITLSFWMLAFSAFLFFSLALVKRFVELEVQLQSGNEKAHGRGYYTADARLVQMLGIASGYASILIFALYLNSKEILCLYRKPEFVWGAIPILLFWISWMWLQASRGNMPDDPIVFAVKDKASLMAGAVFVLVIIVGTVGFS